MSSSGVPAPPPAFPSGAPDFEPAAARWLARWSKLAYESKHDVAEALAGDGFESVVFFDVAGTQGYLGVHPGMEGRPPFAVVAFRGTENDFADILTDITFFKGKATDWRGRAHAGFLMALKQVWGIYARPPWPKTLRVSWKGPQGLGTALDRLDSRFPNIRTFFTGHSLGAALATLALFWWEEPEVKEEGEAPYSSSSILYTFGSPRVAATDFAEYLNRKIRQAYRVVNSTDTVPRVPPGAFGFRHVGALVYFNRAGRLCRPNEWWIRVWERARELPMLFTLLLPRSWVRRIQPRIFTNHRISEYVRKLQAVLGGGKPDAGSPV